MTPTQERIAQLIEKGETVLSTHKPTPPNVLGFPTLDHLRFMEWRTQTIAFLSSHFGPSHVYVAAFKENVGSDAFEHSVQAGIGILRAAREDLHITQPSPPRIPGTEKSVHFTDQICHNGHVITTKLEDYPGIEQVFCATCGAETLTCCPQCRQPIEGSDRYRMNFQQPAYCPVCGTAFPWTAAAIAASQELAIRLQMEERDRTELPKLIEDLVRQTPRMPLAAIRTKQILERLGPVAIEGFKQILYGLVT